MQLEHQLILGVLLAIASASDVAWRRIPNALAASLAAGGLAVQWLSGGASAVLGAVLAGGAVFALLLLPWALGKVGGGDLKLLAATALWLGPSRLVALLIFTGMAAIPVALASHAMHLVQLWRAVRLQGSSGPPAGALSPPRETVPVAVAIALGALASLRWSIP